MRLTNLLFLLAVLFFFACGQKEEHKAESHESHEMTEQTADTGEKTVYYTCPMESHKHIHAKEAGKCPECGMAMVASVVTSAEKMEFYGCPMEAHSHVRKEEAGKCDECGMMLKPMRLVKDEQM